MEQKMQEENRSRLPSSVVDPNPKEFKNILAGSESEKSSDLDSDSFPDTFVK
jgi:hypothetical protein